MWWYSYSSGEAAGGGLKLIRLLGVKWEVGINNLVPRLCHSSRDWEMRKPGNEVGE